MLIVSPLQPLYMLPTLEDSQRLS